MTSSSEPSHKIAVPMSVSEISFYHGDSATVSMADQAAPNRAGGAATSDGMPRSAAESAARDEHNLSHAPHPPGAHTLTPAASRVPAEQPAPPAAGTAQQNQPEPVPDQDPTAALQLCSQCTSLERSADPASLPHTVPPPPSLQSWGNNANDQCSLASKSVSLDTFSAVGAASPSKSNAFIAGCPGPQERAEAEQMVSLQQAGKDVINGGGEADSAARRAHPESSPASHRCDNAPAFWEGRRRSSSSSGHVHGSSAALSALAQAYSRAGQGSPAPAPAAQDAQMEHGAASERSPLEVSELLRVMAMKIDSQSNLQDMALPPCPALQATTGACSSPTELDSMGVTTGAASQNAPQKGPVSEQWGAPTNPGPANPIAAACEQAELEAKAQGELPHAPSGRAGSGSAALPVRDGNAEKSVTALSTCCEVGSCVAPASQSSPLQSAQTMSQGRSAAHCSPDSWNGNTFPCAAARGEYGAMLAADSSGRVTPMDRSQHSARRSRLAGRVSGQEGAWESQRRGTSGSAPNSGSNRKSSALEDSAKESICPGELETMERAWVTMMGPNASAAEKLRQQAAWQKQTLNPRDSAASASQAGGPNGGVTSVKYIQRTQSASRRSDVDASCENQAGSRIPLSRSGKCGLSATCTPVSDAGFFESEGSAGSRLTASNLTEFDNLQRQVSRKDKPRSPLHERTHAWLAQAELPLEFEYSARRAAKLKERCDSYTAKMSNPFETRRQAVPEAPVQPEKKPNIFKRFIACITIEPW